MRKVISVTIGLGLTLSISSCGLSTAEVDLLLRAQENEYVLKASENNLKAAQSLSENANNYSNLQGLDPTVAAMIVMSENYSRSMETAMDSMSKIVSAVTGNSPEGTNIYDVVRESVRQKGETTRSITSSVVNLSKWGFGAWAATDIFKSFGKYTGDNYNYTSGDNSTTWSNIDKGYYQTNSTATSSGESISASTPSSDFSGNPNNSHWSYKEEHAAPEPENTPSLEPENTPAP